MMNTATQDVCAICLERLSVKDGQALFTAECSHVIHFNCIANSVQFGNHICPTCRHQWTNLPSQFTPVANNAPPPPNSGLRSQNYRMHQHEGSMNPIYNDDEPLPLADSNGSSTTSSTRPSHTHTQKMTVKALPERPAMCRSEESDSFVVLVGIRAPPLSPEPSDRPDARAPVDLVAVLDVSGSMNGEKIRLLKQAMGFVVENLGPTDRISVITFSTTARRVTPLMIMGDVGKAHTIRAVNSIRASRYTNIISGLKLGVQVLEQRRQKNPVASIILLSDGQDNQNGDADQFLQALHRLPPCIRANATDQPSLMDVAPVPVHTFGFGSDHDASALHAIADGSGGTFSYIESIEIIQDAFARCVGGLLSVVAQQCEIHVQSGLPGSVRIRSIASGMYRNTIDNEANQHGTVYIGDVYAEEEKKFLVKISVPKEETDTSTTTLLEVKCSYTDPISNHSITTETMTAEIRRPAAENITDTDRQACIEVDRERNRVSVAEGIAQAQAMADRGEFSVAQTVLQQQLMSLIDSPSVQAGDRLSLSLGDKVREIGVRMADKSMYESSGKAYANSMRNSHGYQRASTQALKSKLQVQAGRGSSLTGSGFGASAVSSSAAPYDPDEGSYETTFMRKMVSKSLDIRLFSNQQSRGSDDSIPRAVALPCKSHVPCKSIRRMVGTRKLLPTQGFKLRTSQFLPLQALRHPWNQLGGRLLSKLVNFYP